MPVNRPLPVYLRVILLHCVVFMAPAATVPLAATLSNSTLPPGGTAQLQFFLTANKTITSGTATITLDPAIFDNIRAADVYSATGDQTGAANIQGHQVVLNFQSLTGGIGRLPALPVLTVTAPILSTAKPGASSTPTFNATLTDGTGQQYTATLLSGSLTVGGTLSVQSVQRMGTSVTITGTGFAAATTVQIDGLALSTPQFVNAQQLNVTLAEPANLELRRISVQNPDSRPVAFFPILHAGSPTSFQPIIPLQLYPAAQFGSPIQIPQGQLALQNPTQNSVEVTLIHDSPDATLATVTTAMLAPGATSVQPAPESNVSTDYVIPNVPIRMAQGQPANFGSVSAYVVPPPQLAIYNGNNTVASGVKFNTSVGVKPAQVALTVANAFPINFTASASTASGGSWLFVSPQQDAACTAYIGSYPPICPVSNQVTVSVDPATLGPGTYTGTLIFLPQAPNPQPTTVAVALSVYATPQISVDQSSIGFSFQAGDPSSSRIIHLTSTADPAAFTASASTQSGQKWLSVSPAQGQTPAALTITLTPSAFIGTSDQGTITITGPGNTLVVSVQAQIPPPPTPPVIMVTPTAMQIPYQIGQANPAALELEPHLSTSTPPMGNPFTVSAQTTSGGNWLTAAVPANFAVPYIIVSVNPAGLASGTYQGNVTVSAAAAPLPVQVPVTLYVFSTPPPITASPSALSFTVVQGAVSTPQTVNIATGAIPLVLTSAIATSDSNNWLKLQINNYVDDYLQSVGQPNTPTAATVTIDATNQPPGSYTGTIALTAPQGSSNSVTIPVNVTVQAAPPPPPPPAFIPVAPMGTAPLVTAILNGASQSPGSLSPGEIITIFGQNFGPATPNGLILASGRVATSNSSVQVLFDNIPAPLLYVSSTQINAIVPYEATGPTTSVTIQYNGIPIAAGGYAVSASSPAIFTQDATGQGSAAVLNQDNTLNTPANPAPRGSTIQIYATGAGGSGVTGGVTGAPNQTPTQSATLSIGGQSAGVAYAGGAPGEVSGVLQVNAVVPQNIAPGASTPLVLTIGTAQSSSFATISVK